MRKEIKRLINKAFESKKTGTVENGRGFSVRYDPETVLEDCIYSLGFIPVSNLRGEIIGYGDDVYEEDPSGTMLFCGYEPVVHFSKEDMHILKLAGLN